jgi:hypothetical protein
MVASQNNRNVIRLQIISRNNVTNNFRLGIEKGCFGSFDKRSILNIIERRFI